VRVCEFTQVLEDPTDDGVKSTLIIRNSRQEQFGAYNCTASNYYGSDSIEISLVPKSKRRLKAILLEWFQKQKKKKKKDTWSNGRTEQNFYCFSRVARTQRNVPVARRIQPRPVKK